MRPRSNDAPAVALDALELWVRDVGNATRILTDFGFERDTTARAGRTAEAVATLRCGAVRFVVRQGLAPSDPVYRHATLHGDGVGDVGLVCDRLDALLDRARRHGVGVSFDKEVARIDVLGDGTMLHSLRERTADDRNGLGNARDPLFVRAVDHVSYCLRFGTMDEVARRYRLVLDLDELPNAEYSEIGNRREGMRSIVLRSSCGFTVVLTEPMDESSTGQTQRFVEAHAGPGVQHVALDYPDLLAAVELLRARGIPFLPVPAEHLERSRQRLGDVALPWDALCRQQILVDGDDSGLLLQLFTAPVIPPSSFFLELIQREGATGFGAGNVRALFAAIDAAARTHTTEAIL